MRLTWKMGLHLAAAGSAITLVTMIGSMPVSASPGGHPGPAGLLPALRGHSSLTTADDPGGEGNDILDSAQQYSAVRTAPGIKVSPAAFAAATRAATSSRKQTATSGRSPTSPTTPTPWATGIRSGPTPAAAPGW